MIYGRMLMVHHIIIIKSCIKSFLLLDIAILQIRQLSRQSRRSGGEAGGPQARTVTVDPTVTLK